MGIEPEKGRTIGRYTIVKRLSVGGMAEIFLAFAAGPGEFRKFVTLKRILPELKEDDDFVELFLEEARISAALSHANIAQVFDLRREEDELYIAMEYVAGEDLSRIMRTCAKSNRKLPLGFACMVVRDACAALHHAHTFTDALGSPTPIVHRDVSPKNVMVAYSGLVKVIDFGIAKMRRESLISRPTSVKGSSGYMSPEQVAGKPVDARSDIFAAGVLLHEMCVGRRLFRADDHGIARPKPEDVVAPALLDASIPPALSDVIMRALDFEPDARFKSAREMARAIEAAAPEMYSEEETAELMRSLFPERIAAVRAIIGSVGAGVEELESAVEELQEQSGSIPREQGSTAPTMRIEPPPVVVREAATAAAKRPRLLTVDDSKTSLQVLQIQLAKAGFEVFAASTPAEAFDALDKKKPEAIILDVMMPEMSGFTMCRLIREREAYRDTPILFLSAACTLDERIQGLEVGADDFIRKPCDAQELALRVRSHLSRVAVMQKQT